MDLILIIIFLAFCYFTGKTIETNHYKNIKKREIALIRKPYISYGNKVLKNKKIESIDIVASSVVVGCDRFKEFCANLKNIFGGNVSAYESVLDRGRREALLRIRELALKKGANLLLNIKYETVSLVPLGAAGGPLVSISAYGTAVKYEQKQH